MTKTTAPQLRAALALLGWNEDAYGHMQITRQVPAKGDPTHVVSREYRVKMQATSVRVEVRGERQSDGVRPWIRYAGGYLKDCAVLPDGRVKLATIIFGTGTAAKVTT